MQNGEHMKSMTLKLTVEELRILATLASDQLFRKEFIDSKMPGHRPNSVDMNLTKSLVGRLRLMVDQESPKKARSSHNGASQTASAPGEQKHTGESAARQ